MERSWILIGMMGAGKTSIGRTLAALSGRKHIDTDLLLQRKLGRPIPQIFKIYGESTFREHETSILRELSPSNTVISTGGGIVVRPVNWDEMQRLGTTIYIQAELHQLFTRLSASKKRRPLLEFEDWKARVEQLFEQRKALYEQADISIEVGDRNVSGVAEAILERLNARQ